MAKPAVSPLLFAGFGLLVIASFAAGCCKNTPPPAQLPASESKAALAAAGDRPSTKASCDACKGTWGRHGLAETDSCICRTKDAGKVCRDGAECEGQCLVAEGDGAFEATEAGPPAKGYWKGKCSEFETTFGCHKTIPHGARARKPELPEDAADTICID